MKPIIFVFTLLVPVFTTVIPHIGPVKTHIPRTYKVSLDDGPIDRWKHIITDYHEPLKRMMN